MEKRGPISKSSDVLKWRRKKFVIRILWVLLFKVLVLMGLSFVSRIDGLEIKNIVVSGNEVITSEEIEEEVFRALSENRFVFFSGKNKFIYSKSFVSLSLKKNIPRILDIQIKREENALLVDIVERKRSYLWCGEYLSEENECYFLDNSGFIFDTAPQFSSGIYFTFYSKIEGGPVGQYILDFDIIKDIDLFIEEMSLLGLPINSLSYLGDGQYEVFINISRKSSFLPKILFTKDQSLDEVYNKIASIVDEEPFKSDFEKNENGLEYIDVRFKNRVFYRFLK